MNNESMDSRSQKQLSRPSSEPSENNSSVINRVFGRTLGSQALSRSWWRRWVYPVLFLITLTLSLATYLTLDSIQQSVNTYINDNQRALVGGDLILSSNQDWPAEVLTQVQTSLIPKRSTTISLMR